MLHNKKRKRVGCRRRRVVIDAAQQVSVRYLADSSTGTLTCDATGDRWVPYYDRDTQGIVYIDNTVRVRGE